jgi:predicted nucleic acid-binding protein
VSAAAAATIAYVDSSALVKLVVPEPESAALRAELSRWNRHVSSALARVEVVRACARVDRRAVALAEQVVGALDLVAVDEGLLAEAARLAPPELRALDSIHIASALLFSGALGVAIAYDVRMLGAMTAAGLPTLSPH